VSGFCKSSILPKSIFGFLEIMPAIRDIV